MKTVGPWLCDILLHVAICDLPVADWGPLNGRARTHGIGVLYVALDALSWHYSELRRVAA